jgi:hypothetical protein
MKLSVAESKRVLLSLLIAFAVVVSLQLSVSDHAASASQTGRSFSRAVGQIAPVTQRVVAYGHPYPGKLQFLVASAIVVSLPLLAVVWGIGDKYAKGQWASKLRGAADLVVLCSLVVYLLYWPAHSITAPWGELSSSVDMRRRLFHSDLALHFSLPIFSTGLALLMDAVFSNLREARRRFFNE